MRKWLPVLITGGVELALLSYWVGAVSVTQSSAAAPHGLVEYFLYRYQTFIAGFIAIAAAAIGAQAVYAQIRQTDEESKNSRKRKARATRAMLPLALSSVMEYAEQCLKAMNALRPQCVGQALPSPVPNVPDPVEWPEQALVLMRDYIEHADDEVAVPLTNLISKLQVQRSRFTEVLRHAGGVPARATPLSLNLESYVMDAAEVYARASSLFGHARRDVAVPQLKSADVTTAMNLMGMNDFDDASLYTRVTNYSGW